MGWIWIKERSGQNNEGNKNSTWGRFGRLTYVEMNGKGSVSEATQLTDLEEIENAEKLQRHYVSSPSSIDPLGTLPRKTLKR